jgi:hypothetical protein
MESSVRRANAFLDQLPRTRFGTASREVPAFRTCGVTGFYLAVAVALAGGLLAGRSLPVVALLCLTAALSFFVYTYLRRWITGAEKLVLLEHVWFAELCMAGVVLALGEPPLEYLDVIAPALCVFLAGGRVGCLLVGCCHGRPSSLGIVYGEAAVRDGFPRQLQGVRLFPVQALEMGGLLAIGVSGFAALPWAPPGAVFAWFLAGYAVLRFGTEALRGDPRPHWLGLSVPRWMSLAEMAVALWIARDPAAPAVRDVLIVAVLATAVPAALYARRAFDRRPAVLAEAHVRELRDTVGRLARTGIHADDDAAPGVGTSSAGVRVGVSPGAGSREWLHASFSLIGGLRDLELLCEVVEAAFPDALISTARATGTGVLHVVLPTHSAADPTVTPAEPAAGLYGAVVKVLQGEGERLEPAGPPESPPAELPVSIPRERAGYFGIRTAEPLSAHSSWQTD